MYEGGNADEKTEEGTPLLFGCKENVGVLRVELKSLPNIRPTH